MVSQETSVFSEEMSNKIKEIEKIQKKLLSNTKKTLTRTVKDINSNLPKFKKGLDNLAELEEEKMADGVEAVAAKRKSLLRSLRALGEWVRYSKNELVNRKLEEEVDLKIVESWNYSQFKEWLRIFSKSITNIDKELAKADSIMGLDFSLKKRSATSPLSKIREYRHTLRDLFQNEFQLIKTLEDINRIKQEIISQKEEINRHYISLEDIDKQLEDLQSEVEMLNEIVKSLENEGEVKKFRDLKVKYQMAELKIESSINPFKKSFRAYSFKASSLSGATSYLVGIASQYENDVKKNFLIDSENNFSDLNNLLSSIIDHSSQLKLKANLINRCRQLQDQIIKGNLNNLKSDYLELKDKLIKWEKDEKVVIALEKVELKKSEATALEDQMKILGENKEILTFSIKELNNANNKRSENFKVLYEEGLNFTLD